MKLLKSNLMLLTIFIGGCLFANTDSRTWNFASGEKVFAELVTYTPETKTAILRKDEIETSYPIEEFSKPDAAWLIEWAEFSDELDELTESIDGEFQHYQSEGQYPSDYYVYTPSKYKTDKNLPLLFLFHPGGKGARYVQRMMLSAESLSMIVICSDDFYNTGGVWMPKDDEMLARFKELWGIVKKTIPHNSDKRFMGGSSGGAMRAYQYSGMIEENWAGIWANGGWLGGPKYYDWKYGKNMRIAMVNGSQDRGVNSWFERDSKVLKSHGSIIELFSFEGGHQVPPPLIQYKSLLWMLDIPNPKSHHLESE